ncbi:MAG: hypothetical protein JWM66_1101 [Solirubrobacterales bacterium]|nr:hypothetical protein [Solirubrobacterales bacterium]
MGMLLALLALLASVATTTAFGSVGVSQSGWSWGNPAPQGRTLNAITFAGPLGYAVGTNGAALKTLDGGATWSGLATGTSAELTRVQIVDANTVVVGSSNGCVVRISTDGGVLFTKIFTLAEANCQEPVQAFSFVTAQVGFVLLRNGSVLATSDGGSTFSRRTGVPGTGASSGGGGNTGIDVHFTTPTNGVVFAGPPSGGQSTEFKTSDGGVSWTPVTLPSANIGSVRFIDATHAFAIGPNTLLSSADGGATWTSEPIAAGNSFNSIDCADAKTCTLTITGGAHLVRTSDGGATSSTITPSSAPILGAAYASATRVVGIGIGGATVVSNDGGATFSSASSDIGGSYKSLRAGPGGLVYAPGTNGTIALSTNGGASWSTIATQTSITLRDVSFASSSLGYALDMAGGLQLTTNGGTSWKTLDPGTSRPAEALAALSGGSVLLVGPVGINRSVAGGRFNPVAGRVAARAHVYGVDVAGSTTFAYGIATLIRSTNAGASWKALRVPLENKRGISRIVIRKVSFVSASSGMLLDADGRLWRTSNAGRSWSEVLSTGTSSATNVVFADAQHAFLTLGLFSGDAHDAYVLHTIDGGSSWRPQLIGAGQVAFSGLVAEGASNASVLLDASNERQLFFTSSGGEAGAASTLTIATRTTRFTRRKLRRTHGVVRIDGALKGAQGGEQIVVSRRNLAGGFWQHQIATAGANGGSFTTTWHVGASSVFIAQWAGDSGRSSAGSRLLRVTVR